MSTATMALVRAPLIPNSVVEGWDRALLQEALNLVGYRPRAVAEAEEARVKSLNETLLAGVLADLGIEPFTCESVQTYQNLMLKQITKSQSSRFVKYMHATGDRSYGYGRGQAVVHRVGWPVWALFSISSALALGFHFIGVDGPNGLTQHMHGTQMLHFIEPSLVGLAAWTALMVARYKKAINIHARWNNYRVGACEYHTQAGGSCSCNSIYQEAIPAFVLQRMVSLKKALPEVAFSVQQLDATKTNLNTASNERVDPDPFLIATYKDISVYIDVWAEPAFEGRRQV